LSKYCPARAISGERIARAAIINVSHAEEPSGLTLTLRAFRRFDGQVSFTPPQPLPSSLLRPLRW
jgi:hypothetical protein